MKCWIVLILGCLAVGLGVQPARAAQHVTTPKEQFGFNIGDDYCLANYTQMVDYWFKLARESDRIKVIPIGMTAEGRTQWMAIITAPANHRRIARLREVSKRMALAADVSEKDAADFSRSGRAVVWIDGGLHSSETLGSQQLIETVFQLVDGRDLETLRILDNVVILAVPANPDGIELVSDWYMREADPKKRTYATLPRLYQKYIGHDDNRDFYAVTQPETKNMNRVMYREWFPQVVYNHHQPGPPGTVLFCPPFRDPFNYNVDPLVINGIDQLGAAIMNRFLVEGKPGATTRSGSRYSTWYNGGLRTTSYFHNMIGLLTETIGSPTPLNLPLNFDKQLPKADLLSPIAPQRWHFRQSIDYSVSANKAVLDFAARHRTDLLYNIWLMGKRAIERGGQDSWTITPKRVESAREIQGRKTVRGPAGPGDYERLLHKPEWRDARAYVIPSNQPDFLTAIKFVNALIQNGVKVQRSATAFDLAGKTYPAGSFVISCAQAFRAHVVDMFEPQDHPDDIPYPGAAPTPPYDITGWTLALQMGVKFDRVFENISCPLMLVKDEMTPPPARVQDQSGAVGFFLGTRANDSFRAVNRLLAAGEEVARLTQTFAIDGINHEAGMFYVRRKDSTLPLLEKTARELGVRFVGTTVAPGDRAQPLHAPRIGLWDRYGGSIPSGWTRWLLEQFEFSYRIVYPPELDAGGLREKFDVLILVDGAIGSRSGTTNRTGAASAPSGDAPPEVSEAQISDDSLPPDLRGRRGNITAGRTIPQLRAFMEEGGTILALGSSTGLAALLNMPVANHLMEPDKDGKLLPLPREKFYIPGSLLDVHIDTSNPLAYGMADRADLMYVNDPVFKLEQDAQGQESGQGSGPEVHPVVTFDSAKPLRSGWALGQKYLDGGVAVAAAGVGEGQLILYGPGVTFRAQPHGTFKLFFNGLFWNPEKN